MNEIVDWAIQERQRLKGVKAYQRQTKPQDIQTQIIIGAKMKAFQQVIDKFMIRDE